MNFGWISRVHPRRGGDEHSGRDEHAPERTHRYDGANAFVQCVAAVLSLLVLVLWRTGSFAALGAAPKYCWFGGVLALAIYGFTGHSVIL